MELLRAGRLRSAGALVFALGLAAGAATAGGDPEAPESWWDPVVERRVGLFNPASDPSPPSGPEAAGRLRSLGYLRGYEPPTDGVGVVAHDAARTQAGYNLYVSGHDTAAFLVTPTGRTVHRWHLRFSDACPSPPTAMPGQRWWRRAHLLPDGGLLAIFEYSGIVRLDRGSKPLWSRCGPYHHDLAVDGRGRILVLRAEHRVRAGGQRVVVDRVEILGPDGERRATIPLLEALSRSRRASLLERTRHADLLHTNAIRLLGPARLPDLGGDVLLSMRNLDLLAALDLESGRFTWTQVGSWRAQHDPVLLEDGAILLFDNLGRDGRSRVVEIEAGTGEVRWSYPDSAEDVDLDSPVCGSVQRLPNGNTLITESTAGRALEITRTGEIVWEFRSPHRIAAEDGSGTLVALLGHVTRIPPASVPWLDAPSEAGRDPPSGSPGG